MTTNNGINLQLSGIPGYDGAGTFVSSNLTPNAVLLGLTSNTISSQLLTNGQLLIGNTGNPPTAAQLTAGSGISIANASGSITISSVGGGLSWTVVTGISQAMAINSGYFANNGGLITFTLPVSCPVGSAFAVSGMDAALGWVIAQNAGQQIFFGTASTTAGTGGSLASTKVHDSIMLVCNVANTSFIVQSSIGNITVV